jgi:hypothetical protein
MVPAEAAPAAALLGVVSLDVDVEDLKQKKW